MRKVIILNHQYAVSGPAPRTEHRKWAWTIRKHPHRNRLWQFAHVATTPEEERDFLVKQAHATIAAWVGRKRRK